MGGDTIVVLSVFHASFIRLLLLAFGGNLTIFCKLTVICKISFCNQEWQLLTSELLQLFLKAAFYRITVANTKLSLSSKIAEFRFAGYRLIAYRGTDCKL